jgi:sugar transferase (PEP-CTERM system associated)
MSIIKKLDDHGLGMNESSGENVIAHVLDKRLTGKLRSIKKGTKAGRGSTKAEIFLGFPRQRWLLIFIDLFLIALGHYVALFIRFGDEIHNIFLYTQRLIVPLLIYPVTMYIFDLYNISRAFRSWETSYRSTLAIILGGTLSIFIFYLMPESAYGRGVMAIHMAIIWILLNGWRWIYSFLFQAAINAKKIPALILGAGNSGNAVYELLKSRFSPYEIKGFLDDDPAKRGLSMSPAVLGTCDQLILISKQIGIHTAIMAIPRNRSKTLVQSILKARIRGVEVLDSPDIFERFTGRIPVQHIGDQWLLFAEGFYLLHKEYVQKLKRLIDLSVSTIVLVLTAPLIGLTALAIRLESTGPVLYTQERVGRDEQNYTIYKFRSMRRNAEVTGAKWASENDSRITRVGKWLRLTHIDELPQLWNVFKGDMSFVGPRPERPEFVRMLEKELPYYFVRHSIQPGLTGWAQINYQYGASVEDALRKLEYDLYYVKNMSIMLDLKIILKTMGTVILRDGAR